MSEDETKRNAPVAPTEDTALAPMDAVSADGDAGAAPEGSAGDPQSPNFQPDGDTPSFTGTPVLGDAPDLVIPSVAGEDMMAGEQLAVDVTAGVTTVVTPGTPQMSDPATLLGLANTGAQLPPAARPEGIKLALADLKELESLALFWGGDVGVKMRNLVVRVRGNLTGGV